MTSTAVLTEQEYKSEIRSLDSQIFNLQSQRELALARGEKPRTAELWNDIAALGNQRDDLLATMRGARRLQEESSRTDDSAIRRAALRQVVSRLDEVDSAWSLVAETWKQLKGAIEHARRAEERFLQPAGRLLSRDVLLNQLPLVRPFMPEMRVESLLADGTLLQCCESVPSRTAKARHILAAALTPEDAE